MSQYATDLNLFVYMSTMQFHADHIYTLVDGNLYAVMFAESATNSQGGYLFIQRKVGDQVDDMCYIETHDRKYSGRFRMHRLELTARQLLIELDRPHNNLIRIHIGLTPSKLTEVSRVISIIRGDQA